VSVEDLVSWRDLVEHLAEGVYVTDRERKILFWSRGAEQITGYPASAVVGTHCWDNILMHVDSAARSLCKGACPLVAAIMTGRPQVTEAYLRHRDGYRLPVIIRTMPVRDAGGRIAGVVESFTDNSALAIAREKTAMLESLAMTDVGTDLPNRRYLQSAIQSRLHAAARYGWRFGVIFADVDNFKSVNDRWGHDVGDRVLMMIGRTLTASCRSTDTAGRWGGEEFVVVSDADGIEALGALAERLRMLVMESRLALEDGNSLSVTVSCGATMAEASDTVEKLMTRADALMYSSKQKGKNAVTTG